MKCKILIIIQLIFCASSLFASAFNLNEEGKYEVSVFIKPRFTAITKKAVLTPEFKHDIKYRILSDESNNIYHAEMLKKENFSFTWGIDNINVNEYSQFKFENSLNGKNAGWAHIFYVDTDNDKIADKSVFFGDQDIFIDEMKKINGNKESVEFNNRVISAASLTDKVLSKLNLITYKEWKYSLLHATIVHNSEKDITELNFQDKGQVKFFRNINNIDINKYPFFYFENDIKHKGKFSVRAQFVLKEKSGLLKNQHVLITNYTDFELDYLVDLKSLTKSHNLEIKNLELVGVNLWFRNNNTIPGLHTLQLNIKKVYFAKIFDVVFLTNDSSGTKSIFDNITKQDIPVQISSINTIIKNKTDKNKKIFFKPLIFDSLAGINVPVVYAGNPGEIDTLNKNNIVGGNESVVRSRVWELHDSKLTIGLNDFAKNINNRFVIYKTGVNKYFSGLIHIIPFIKFPVVYPYDLAMTIKGIKDNKEIELHYGLYRVVLKDLYINEIKITSHIHDNIDLLKNFNENYFEINELNIDIYSISLIKKPEKVYAKNLRLNFYDPVKDFTHKEDDNLKDKLKNIKQFNVYADFTDKEIINGGKWVSLGEMQVDIKKFAVKFDNTDSFEIGDVLLKKQNYYYFLNKENSDTNDKKIVKESRSAKLIKAAIFIIFLSVIILAIYFIKRKNLYPLSINFIDSLFGIKTFFFTFQGFLLILVMNDFSKTKANPGYDISNGLIVLIGIFALSIRYYIRPFLSRYLNYFNEKYSSIYFGTAILGLFITAMVLIAGNEKAAEKIAVFVYFLLITGIVIEIKEYVSRRE